MINEEKLKEVIQDIITWTGINDRPDVKKMIEKKLNEVINKKKKSKRTTGEIMDSINKLLGFNKYKDKIKWSSGNKEEMLRLELAIRCLKGKESVKNGN